MTSQKIPTRQIRANYTSETITVYQAYNSEIANSAIKHQKLNASPKFSISRMTWIKPSWAWMLYRSGYSYKDPGQERILALSLTHAAFLSLLRKAVLSTVHGAKAVKRDGQNDFASVRVQWDPERTVRLGKLDYRSIQIGVPGDLVEELVGGIVKIEDVTDKAQQLKKILDEDENIDVVDLIAKGLVPEERPFEVDEELRVILKMDNEEKE